VRAVTAADLVTPADLARTEERILLAIATSTAEILDAIRQNDRHVPGPTTPPGGPENDHDPPSGRRPV
jgi:hypothetical protein